MILVSTPARVGRLPCKRQEIEGSHHPSHSTCLKDRHESFDFSYGIQGPSSSPPSLGKLELHPF